MGRRLLLVLAGCLVAGSLVGCGGSGATKKDVIARGNAICTATLRAQRIVGSPAAGVAGALSAYLQRAVPLVDREVAQLHRLPRPALDRGLLERYLAAATRAQGQYRALAAAARRHDTAGIAQALAALRANPAPRLARRYGLAQCAAAASTSPS